MKYKVGDKVVLRDDLVEAKKYGGWFGSWKMLEGEESVTIRRISKRNQSPSFYDMEGYDNQGYITDEMIDHKKTEEFLAERMRGAVPFGNSNIQPKHYNKGDIDLYESAYQTRPFNEYRAIMEFVAERYIKQDKTNRIEDIEKAIYTLERLKEKEERHERNEI